MICIPSDELQRPLLDHLEQILRNDRLNIIIERLIHPLSFTRMLHRPIHNPLSHRITQNLILHVVSELAEEFVVEADGPVFGEELADVGDETVLVTAGQFVEVFYGEADEGH